MATSILEAFFGAEPNPRDFADPTRALRGRKSKRQKAEEQDYLTDSSEDLLESPDLESPTVSPDQTEGALTAEKDVQRLVSGVEDLALNESAGD